MRVEWSSYSSPVGALTLVEADGATLVVEYADRADALRWPDRLREVRPRVPIAAGGCGTTRAWLDDYFAGRPRPFPFPWHVGRWFPLSPAQVVVHRTIWAIPFGETRSYDDIARETGLPPRLVGQLVAANHLAVCIPCHRVVGKDGGLVGYGGGLERKRWLLDHELRTAGLILR